MLQRIIALALALTMMGALTMGAAAHHRPGHGGSGGNQTAVGTATGLVAAVVNANVLLEDVEINVVRVEIEDSLNNLLRDSRILNNLLRNADVEVNVIRVGDINVQDVITIGDVTVTIQDVLQDFLNDLNLEITVQEFLNQNVVAIGILSGGLIVFQNP
jgi:hypothetical protein